LKLSVLAADPQATADRVTIDVTLLAREKDELVICMGGSNVPIGRIDVAPSLKQPPGLVGKREPSKCNGGTVVLNFGINDWIGKPRRLFAGGMLGVVR
jgi:hypothetical protein